MRRYYSYRKHLQDIREISGNPNFELGPFWKTLDGREITNNSYDGRWCVIGGKNPFGCMCHIDWTTKYGRRKK